MLSIAGAEKLIDFHVDFNDVDQDNRLRALGKFASSGWETVGPNQWVRVYDEEGNECLALVESVVDGFFYLRADWDTWQTGETSRLRVTRDAPRFTTQSATSSLTR